MHEHVHCLCTVMYTYMYVHVHVYVNIYMSIYNVRTLYTYMLRVDPHKLHVLYEMGRGGFSVCIIHALVY